MTEDEFDRARQGQRVCVVCPQSGRVEAAGTIKSIRDAGRGEREYVVRWDDGTISVQPLDPDDGISLED